MEALAALAEAAPLPTTSTQVPASVSNRNPGLTLRAILTSIAVTVIFARGTGETGNIGSVVGPSLKSNLNSQIQGGVAFQGVDYPADAAGNVPGGQGQGTSAFQSEITKAQQKCPDTKIVMSGYSQGAILVHSTAAQNTVPIAAAVTFGDPEVSASTRGREGR